MGPLGVIIGTSSWSLLEGGGAGCLIALNLAPITHQPSQRWEPELLGSFFGLLS